MLRSGTAKEPRDDQQQEATQHEGQRKEVMSSESSTWGHLGQGNWNHGRSCPGRSGPTGWVGVWNEWRHRGTSASEQVKSEPRGEEALYPAPLPPWHLSVLPEGWASAEVGKQGSLGNAVRRGQFPRGREWVGEKAGEKGPEGQEARKKQHSFREGKEQSCGEELKGIMLLN